ncbi:5'-Nucleotidase [Elysia marginata]|uniref:5'-Nucleotidase n=1 Tax=Elysia marginata TaxID=1093978 RepID=A0AAV4IZ69_9GAST|nr:5'-Nucleotidase [Elysia marginata]
MIVALTHMRVPNDKILAESVPGIDIILGGHDHEYEVIKIGSKYVVKSGTDFREMSKITMKKSSGSSWDVEIEKVELDSCVAEDEDMKAVVTDRLTSVDEKMDTYLGHMNVDMDGKFASVRTQETNLGNFVCDIMLTATKADCAILNSGTLRSDRIHLKGDFKIRDLLTILPMMDNCVVIKVTGAQLVQALENGVSKYPVKEGRFPQVAGLSFGFDPTHPPGQRVGRPLVKIRGEYIDMERHYRLATKEYLSLGKDGYDVLKDCEILHYRLATKEYLSLGKDGYDVLKDCEILVSAEQCPALSTMVQNHFESVAIHQGQVKCRSGHRQSLVALTIVPQDPVFIYAYPLYQVSAEQCPALSTMVQNHFESVAIHQGQVKCRSGHRQSLVALTMREDLMKMLHANNEIDEEEDTPKRLVRQESIHCLEMEQSFLSPKIDGRIYILTEEKRHVMQSMMPSGMVRNLSTVREELGSQSWSSMSQASQDDAA